MRATIGDRITVKGHHVGDPQREGEIIEVRGLEGRPPYRVRWFSDGHEAIVYPGADAMITPRVAAR